MNCTCGQDLTGAPWCRLHRCDCNIMCGHRGKSRPHVFAPGEWCGGNDETWIERRRGGRCRVHPETKSEASADAEASLI